MSTASRPTPPRDPAALTDDDLPTMTEEEEAAYYYANRHRLGEIFGGETAEFEFAPDTTTTLSIRLRRGEVAELERAAAARGKKLSTFVREAALTVARNPDAGGLVDDATAVRSEVVRALESLLHVARLTGSDAGKIDLVYRAASPTELVPGDEVPGADDAAPVRGARKARARA